MPAWLIGILLELVLKFGIPALVAWLKKVFKIGESSEMVQVLQDYVSEAKTDKRMARARARRRLRELRGIECPPEPKLEDKK